MKAEIEVRPSILVVVLNEAEEGRSRTERILQPAAGFDRRESTTGQSDGVMRDIGAEYDVPAAAPRSASKCSASSTEVTL